MTLPPVNDFLLGKLDPEERPAVVAEVARDLDPASWRWETWALIHRPAPGQKIIGLNCGAVARWPGAAMLVPLTTGPTGT